MFTLAALDAEQPRALWKYHYDEEMVADWQPAAEAALSAAVAAVAVTVAAQWDAGAVVAAVTEAAEAISAAALDTALAAYPVDAELPCPVTAAHVEAAAKQCQYQPVTVEDARIAIAFVEGLIARFKAA